MSIIEEPPIAIKQHITKIIKRDTEDVNQPMLLRHLYLLYQVFTTKAKNTFAIIIPKIEKLKATKSVIFAATLTGLIDSIFSLTLEYSFKAEISLLLENYKALETLKPKSEFAIFMDQL